LSYDEPAQLSLLSVPQSLFGQAPTEASARDYAALPSAGSRFIANRFTERYLVYGALNRYRSGLPRWNRNDSPDDPEALRWRRRMLAMPPAFAVRIDRPQDVEPLDVGHTVIRAEQVGNDIVLTGYRDRGGLQVSLIDLDRRPRIASNIRLDGRFESEGRSHAFNSMVEADGSGMMGLPTAPRRSESGREPWRSRASDLSFLELDADGQLSLAGELRAGRRDYANDDDGHPGYSCEVSCIDWYGNSRPIFTDGRIFGLTGTELIEGRLVEGQMREIRRLDVVVPRAASGSR
jgi:hypothetical protein